MPFLSPHETLLGHSPGSHKSSWNGWLGSYYPSDSFLYCSQMHFPGHLLLHPGQNPALFKITQLSSFSLLLSIYLQLPSLFPEGCSISFSFPFYHNSGNHQGWHSKITLFLIISFMHLSCCGETVIAHWIPMYSFELPLPLQVDGAIWLLLDKGL